MKITELINAKNAFDLNCKYDGDIQLAFKVVKFIKSIETEANFYQKSYSDIVLKYADKDENGNDVRISKDHISDFKEEIAKLDSIDVDKPEITFTFDELSKCDLTGNGLYALYPFVAQFDQ